MPDTIVLMNQLITARRKYTLGLAPATPSWSLRLFVNNNSPLCTDTFAGNYTECTLAGYAAISLVAGSWTGSLTSCVDTWNYPTQTFTMTAGGQTIYGHLLYDSANVVLGWVDLWATPFVVPSGGGVVSIALQWSDKQC